MKFTTELLNTKLSIEKVDLSYKNFLAWGLPFVKRIQNNFGKSYILYLSINLIPTLIISVLISVLSRSTASINDGFGSTIDRS